MIFILKNVLLLQVLVIMSVPVHFISCNFCKSKEDTNKCGICALCFDKYASDKEDGSNKAVGFYCVIPKLTSTFKNPPKCDFVEKCIENQCENHATCETFFGTAQCFCGTSNYGQKCQFNVSDGKGYITDVKVLYKPIVKALQVVQLMISFRGIFNDIYVDIADGQHQRIILTSRAFRKSSPRSICLTNKIAPASLCNLLPNDEYYYALVNLFYRTNPPPSQLTDITDNIIVRQSDSRTDKKTGYFNQFHVDIGNNLLDDKGNLFREDFDLTVYTDDDMEMCTLNIVLQNCDASSIAPTSFKRTEEWVITGHVDRPETCNSSSTTTAWKVWRFGLNFDELRNTPLFEAVDIKNYTIKPFSLKTGLYRIKLSTVVTYEEGLTASDFVYCFFKIIDLALIAIISGGNSRTAYAGAPLLLDASSSEDPNEPHNRQFHLMFIWSCDHKEESFCGNHVTKSKTYKVDGPFNPNQTYRFDLTVSGKNLKSVTTSQLVVMTATKMPNLMIRCYLNCGKKSVGANPDFQVYLIVEVEGETVPQYQGFTWSYEVNGKNMTNIKEITYDNLPPHICIVKPNALNESRTYTFIVTRWNPYSVSTINIKVHTRPTGGVCTAIPKAGRPMFTKFQINCIKYHFGWTYEFYNGQPRDEGVDILFAYNTNGILYNQWIVTNHVKIRIIDIYGMYTEEILSLMINRVTQSQIHMYKMKNLAKAKLKMEDAVGATVLLTMSTEYLNLYSNRSAEVVPILSIVEQDKTFDKRHLNRVLAVLYRTLHRGVPLNAQGLSFDGAELALKLLTRLCKGYYKMATNAKDTIPIIIDHSILNKITFSLFVSITSVMEGTEQFVKYNKIKEEIAGPKYSFLFEMFRALELLMKIVHLCLLPAQEPVLIQMKKVTRFYSKADLPSRFAKLGRIPSDGVTFVKMKENVVVELENTYGYVTLQLAVFKRNPFWFELISLSGEVQTEVIYCKLTQKTPHIRQFKEFINHLNSPIDLYLKVNKQNYAEINGSVTLLPQNLTDDQKDESVVVYRLNCPEYGGSAGVHVEFKNLSSKQLLRVALLYNMWPDYDIMMEKSKIITSDNPSIELIALCENEDAFNYIGILPGPKNPVNINMSYSFQVYTAQCLTRIQNMWTPEHCIVLPKKHKGYIHCRCYYMSYVSGTFLVLPEKRDFFKNVELFLTPMTNFNCVIFLASAFTMYILLLVYSYYNDRKDEKNVYINVLKDNVPGDTWPYLIAVYTSGRMFSGTTAHVGIKLIGSLGTSRAHILLSSERDTMQKWCDDWFLIFTPEHLGNIKSLNMWHDWIGSWRDWYCNHIIVYDLSLRKEYYFLVNSWTSVWLNDFSEVNFYPSKPLTKHIFINNLIINLRTLHLFAGIFIRPSRSSLTRSQMLGVQMTLVMLIMFMSYMKLAEFQVANIDSLHLILNSYDWWIAFFTSIIAYLITSFQTIMFRKVTPNYDFVKKSFPKVENPLNHFDNKKETKETETGNESFKYRRNENEDVGFSITEYEKGENFLFHHLRFKPVVMKNEVKKYSKNNKNFLILSWTLFAIAFGCVLSIVPSTFSKGANVSRHWMIVVILAYVHTLLVIYPLKIIVYTLIYTFIYKKSNPESCYVCNTTTQPELMYDKEFMDKLATQRTLSMYSKMPTTELAKMQKFEHLCNMWMNLLDVIMALLYIIIMIVVMSIVYGPKLYRSKTILNETFSGLCTKNGLLFENVVDVSSFNAFLADKFMESCYKTTFYNGDIIEEGKSHVAGWVCDYAHRLIGVPRIRQLRVKPDKCITRKVFAFLGDTLCSSELNEHTEDTGDYGIGWSKLIISKWTNLLSPWKYSHANETSQTYISGRSKKIYHGGGYYQDFSLLPDETNKTISTIITNNWLDENTRVVFLEFSVYNVNTDTISEITIVVEFLPSKATLVEIKVDSDKFTLNFSYMVIVLIVFTLYFLLRIVLKINHDVKSNFTSSILIEVCLPLAGIVHICLYISEMYSKKKLIDKFRTNGLDNYFTFKSKQFGKQLALCVFVVHFICTILFLLKSYRFGERLQKFYFTFIVPKTSVLVFGLLVPIFTNCGLVVTHLLFNPIFPYNFVFITYKFSFKHVLVITNFPENKTAPFVFCLMNNFMMWMFALFLIVSYKTAKTIPITSNYNDNFFIFFWENIRKTKDERLRGGFDCTSAQIDSASKQSTRNRVKFLTSHFIKGYTYNYAERYPELEETYSTTQCIKTYNKIEVFNDIIRKLDMLEEKLYTY